MKIIIYFNLLTLLYFSCNINQNEPENSEQIDIENSSNSISSVNNTTSINMGDEYLEVDKAISGIKSLRFSGDIEGSIRIKCSASRYAFMHPMLVKVKVGDKKIKYRNFTNPLSKIYGSVLPRGIKNSVKHCFNFKNGEESCSHSTFRLLDYKDKKKHTVHFVGWDKTKYRWTTTTIKDTYGGKLEIDKRGVITKLKLDDFQKETNRYYDKNFGLLKKHRLENKILDGANRSHSLIKRNKKSKKENHNFSNNYIFSREHSDKTEKLVLYPFTSPLKMQLVHEFFEFYFIENHKRDIKIAPLFNYLTDINHYNKDGFRKHEILKFTDIGNHEVQFCEFNVTKTLLDDNRRPYPYEIMVIHRDKNNKKLFSYTCNFEYKYKYF